jgi:Putative adhesin
MRVQPIMVPGIALLAASALAITSCVNSSGTASGQNDYTVTDPITTLTIDNPVGSTQIEATDATTISVTERLRYTDNPPQTSHVITGDRLALSYTCPSGVINVGVEVCSVNYVIKVPRRLAVKIDAAVGEATLTGLAGEVTLTSSTGRINATGLTSPAVTARTSAGTVTLAFTAPPTTVDAHTQVGSVTVRLPAGTAYAVDASSQVGGVEVGVQQDSSSAHRIRADSQVGSVTISNG